MSILISCVGAGTAVLIGARECFHFHPQRIVFFLFCVFHFSRSNLSVFDTGTGTKCP